MRPPEFTGGNRGDWWRADRVGRIASMRPPEFTGGNAVVLTVRMLVESSLQ